MYLDLLARQEEIREILKLGILSLLVLHIYIWNYEIILDVWEQFRISKFVIFRYLKYYSGPGLEEDYAIYVYKPQHFDGSFQESLRMTNLRTNETIILATFDRFDKFEDQLIEYIEYSTNIRQVTF